MKDVNHVVNQEMMKIIIALNVKKKEVNIFITLFMIIQVIV